MNLEEIVLDLINRQYEEERFEFKLDWFQPRQLGEYISALSNSATMLGREYAYFIWGIDDLTREIVGTTFNYYQSYNDEPYQNFLIRNLKPSISIEFKEIFINDKRIVVLIIPASKIAPTSFFNERYLRVASSKINLSSYPLREALLWQALSLGAPSMINTPSPKQDLTFNKFLNYLNIHNIKYNENYKENFSLYTSDHKYNVLAAFLSDNGDIPLRIAHFEGKDKTSKLLSIKEFGLTSLIDVIDRIITYSESINIIKSTMKENRKYREDITLFNQDAFNEAIKNAIIHNNWNYLASPMITFYSDRVEIISFSSLAPLQTIEGFFKGISKPVNKELSTIFVLTHTSERSGIGVPLITSFYGKGVFDIKKDYISVTIPYNFLLNEKTYSFNKELSRKDVILYKLKESPYISYEELSSFLNIGITTLNKDINELKKEKKIERSGSKRKGYWKVIE